MLCACASKKLYAAAARLFAAPGIPVVGWNGYPYGGVIVNRGHGYPYCCWDCCGSCCGSCCGFIFMPPAGLAPGWLTAKFSGCGCCCGFKILLTAAAKAPKNGRDSVARNSNNSKIIATVFTFKWNMTNDFTFVLHFDSTDQVLKMYWTQTMQTTQMQISFVIFHMCDRLCMVCEMWNFGDAIQFKRQRNWTWIIILRLLFVIEQLMVYVYKCTWVNRRIQFITRENLGFICECSSGF